MSAMPKTSALKPYQGPTRFLYREENYMTETKTIETIQKTRLKVFTAEIYGLVITGILTILGILASISFGYPLLSLLFIVPLIGVLIGASYITYIRKHGK